MKLDSPLFNRIRVKPEQERKPAGAVPACQWPGCACEATHRAPKGRLREREREYSALLAQLRQYERERNEIRDRLEKILSRFEGLDEYRKDEG